MRFSVSRFVVWAVLYLPLLVFCWQYVTEVIFYGEFIHITGDWSARLLLLTLAVTPLRRLMPGRQWTAWLVRQRRHLGVAVFAYALPHVVAYLVKLSEPKRVLSEGMEPGMFAGWIAMLIFTALAITSNDTSVSQLGRRWKVLHRLVHAAAVLTFLHWVLLAYDPTQGYIHAGMLAVIESLRLIKRPASAV